MLRQGSPELSRRAQHERREVWFIEVLLNKQTVQLLIRPDDIWSPFALSPEPAEGSKCEWMQRLRQAQAERKLVASIIIEVGGVKTTTARQNARVLWFVWTSISLHYIEATLATLAPKGRGLGWGRFYGKAMNNLSLFRGLAIKPDLHLIKPALRGLD